MLLRTLGGLNLEGSGFRRPKPLLLLAYLALEGPKDRRFLAELFCAGATDPANCLATTLKRLRREMTGLIGADEVRVWTTVRTDAQELLTAVRQEAFQEATSLYGGTFLEGVHLRESGAELEEWVYHTREFLANQVRVSLVALADAHADAERYGEAARLAEAAYRLAGAPAPEPDELERLHTFMLAGHSPFASEVRDEASDFELDLAHTPRAARERVRRRLDAERGVETRSSDFTGRRLEQHIRFCTSSDGVRLAYATVGQGPVLIKAANWLSQLDFDWDSPVWRHWLHGLSKHHTLVRYDERGCGLSDWDVEDFSFDAWVRDLETVVDAVGYERFPLLGISQGGAVAIAYAVRHPERVSHLILYGAYARGRLKRDPPPELREAHLQEAEMLIDLIRLGWGRDNPAFRQVFTTNFIPGGTREQFDWFNDLQRVSTSPENAERFTRTFNDIDVTDLGPRVRLPTLVLHVEDDAGIPFEEGRLIASLIPGARFIPMRGRNHLMLESEPAWQRFLSEIHAFIGSQEPAGIPSGADARGRAMDPRR